MLEGKAATVDNLKTLLLSMGLKPTSVKSDVYPGSEEFSPYVATSVFKIAINGHISTVRLFSDKRTGKGSLKVQVTENNEEYVEER